MKKTSIIILILVIGIIAFVMWFVNNRFCCGPINQANTPPKTDYAYLLEFTFDKGETISVKYPYTFSPDQSLFTIT